MSYKVQIIPLERLLKHIKNWSFEKGFRTGFEEDGLVVIRVKSKKVNMCGLHFIFKKIDRSRIC